MQIDPNIVHLLEEYRKVKSNMKQSTSTNIS